MQWLHELMVSLSIFPTQELTQEFIRAVETKDKTQIYQSLDKATNLNATNEYGSTLFHLLATKGNTPDINELFSLLVSYNKSHDHSFNKNALNNSHETPLHLACLFDDFNKIEILCSAQADINILNNDGQFPDTDFITDLLTITRQQIHCFKNVILKHPGYDIKKRMLNTKADQFFHHICHQVPDFVDLMVEKLSDDLCTFITPYKWTILHRAAECNNSSFLKKILTQNPYLINNFTPNTIVHVACFYRRHNLVKNLLALGADPQDISEDHKTMFYLQASLENKIITITHNRKLLADCLYDIEKNENSAYIIATIKQLMITMSFLLPDKNGNIALHHAIKYLPKNLTLSILAAQPLALSITNKQGITPVHLMANNKNYYEDLKILCAGNEK